MPENRKKVLTSGDVAKMLHVSRKLVQQWLDDGTLKGWRIPNSRDRRFDRQEVVRFAQKHGITLSELEAAPIDEATS